MISNREDFGYLLDNLRDISKNYFINKEGKVIDKNGEEVKKERIVTNTEFYILYCLAYKDFDEVRTNNTVNALDKEFIDRALSSYGLFNYFINTCLGEYRIYDDIGTGKVTYIPYQPIADFFFNNDAKKDVLMCYLETELKNVFESENSKKRVK